MAEWKNRIVGYSDEAPDQLLASPFNWRIHPQAQQDALLGVLREAGIVQNILVNRTTGNLIDGHLRVSLALREGQPTVPVTWVELSESEEKLVLLSLDPLSAMAGADKEKLDALLRDVQPESAALQQMLSDLAAREGLYTGHGVGTLEDIPDAQVDRAAELQEHWQTQLGQLWVIDSKTVPGKSHRLLCGDSKSEASIAYLMDNKTAVLLSTDPPYGVDFTGAKYNPRAKSWAGIQNDDLQGLKLTAWLKSIISVWLPHIARDSAFYFWTAPMQEGLAAAAAITACGLHIQGQIIWAKNTFALGQSDYQWRHEPCWYAFLRVNIIDGMAEGLSRPCGM